MFLRRSHYTKEYFPLLKIESFQPLPSGTSPEVLTRYYSNYTLTLYVGNSSFQCFCMRKREIFSRFILLSEGIFLMWYVETYTSSIHYNNNKISRKQSKIKRVNNFSRTLLFSSITLEDKFSADEFKFEISHRRRFQQGIIKLSEYVYRAVHRSFVFY